MKKLFISSIGTINKKMVTIKVYSTPTCPWCKKAKDYFNGKKIGTTMGWDIKRRYNIPVNLIRWNKINAFHIKVTDLGYDGGIRSGPVRLILQ